MTQELIERLEPCPVPWCLGEADADWYAVGEQGRPYWVRCKACGCKTPRQYATVAEAIAAWNTRVQSQSARIAELSRENALMRQAVDTAIVHKMETHTHGGLTEFGEGGLAALRSLEREFCHTKRQDISLTKDSTSEKIDTR